jgi:exonuclease SbcC
MTEPVDLNFDQISEGLIAIVGPNGSGKTSLLEATFAALFRYLPSRDGSLYKWCSGKDAQIVLVFDQDGHSYEARLLIDAVAEKAEAYLMEDGRPLVNGKVTQFSKEIERIVGSPEVVLSSAFSAQKKTGSFSRIPVAERKGLFTELLGLGHYPKLEESAKKELSRQQADLSLQQATRQVATQQAGRLKEAVDRLGDLVRQREEAEGSVDLLAKIDCALRQELLEIVGSLGKFAELERQRGDLLASQQGCANQLNGVRERIRTRKSERQREFDNARAQVLRWRTELISESDLLTAKIAEVSERQANNRKLLEERDRIAAAIAKGETLRARRTELQNELTAAIDSERTVARARERWNIAAGEVALIEQQISGQTRLVEELAGIPCHGNLEYSTCPKILTSVAARGRLPELQSQLATKQALIATIEHRSNGRREASLVQADLRNVDTELEANAKVAKLKASLDVAQQRIAELETILQGALKRQDDISTELEGITAPAATVDDQMLQELSSQETATSDRLIGIDSAVARNTAELGLRQGLLDGQAALTLRIDRSAGELRLARATLSDLTSQIETLRHQQSELVEVQARLVELESQIAATQTEIADWTLLVRALGKDGIPALEIDAAGPAISAIVNDLLSHCFSSRFAIDLQTQKASADGKRMLEDFDIRVLDNRRGAWGSITGLSGGEEVVVNEALGFGISIYNKSAHRFQTAFRDETTGALDPEAAVAYVEMLRRARSVGAFHHVLYITHSPECSELADAVLRCENGKVTVQQ